MTIRTDRLGGPVSIGPSAIGVIGQAPSGYTARILSISIGGAPIPNQTFGLRLNGPGQTPMVIFQGALSTVGGVILNGVWVLDSVWNTLELQNFGSTAVQAATFGSRLIGQAPP